MGPGDSTDETRTGEQTTRTGEGAPQPYGPEGSPQQVDGREEEAAKTPKHDEPQHPRRDNTYGRTT